LNISDFFNTPFGTFVIGLLTASGVGSIIGLEREFNTHGEAAHLGGLRTFTLIALTGFIVGELAQHTHIYLLLAATLGFMGIIGIAYFIQTQNQKLGLTSELGMLLTFFLGVLIAYGYIQEALAAVVVITTILSLKEQLHDIVKKLTNEELFAFIKFIILALLILPMLPNQTFGPDNSINVRDLGLIVIVVLTFNFGGYLLLKFGSPNKGILLSALIGGLFSSTMIAWVFASRSRERPEYGPVYGAGIVLASSVMLVRVFILTTIFAFPVAKLLILPLSMMLLASVVPAIISWRRDEQVQTGALDAGNPLDMKNALFFAGLYIATTLLMYYTREWLSASMVYVSAAITGIADIDAITLSTAKWAATNSTQNTVAQRLILVAIFSNSVFKLSVSLIRGVLALRIAALKGFGMVIGAGVLYLVLVGL
jgi:uncharacterized membrane protein (DUF4010 family)